MFRMMVAGRQKEDAMMRTFLAAVVSMAMLGCFTPADQPTSPQELEVGALNPGDTCSGLQIVDPGSSVQPGTSCVCTRRDAVPNGQCTKGVGETVTATIGPSGGSVMLHGRQGTPSNIPFYLNVPPTALSTDTVIRVTETTIPPPAGMVDWSPVYLVEPVGLVFATPVSMQMPMSNGRGMSEFDSRLSIFWSGAQTCSLERLPSSTPNAGYITASIIRGGYVVAGYAQQGSVPSCN